MPKIDDELVTKAIEADRRHRQETQRPISAESLMRTFGLGAERSRLLMRTVRARWENERDRHNGGEVLN
ncbi:hypothetical protein [Amycolatopsis sp. cmx-11-12]|uniref:hypothetical protein n=1 Tax=Amycolatopsis sp. cmx-11-12 TaxID=2785795 RepID=UPI003916DF8A